MAKKKYKYLVSHTIEVVATGRQETMQSQLYKLGVYVIVNNNTAWQGNATPGQMEAAYTRTQKLVTDGKLKWVSQGREITVTEDEDGFWKEID